MGKGVAIRIGSFPVETPLNARMDLVTQPVYEALGRNCLDAVISIGWVRLPSKMAERYSLGSQMEVKKINSSNGKQMKLIRQ